MSRAIFAGVLVVVLALGVSAPAQAYEDVIYSGIDVWATEGDGRTFIDFQTNPLPAGFFCLRSRPFAGRIELKGEPIATEQSRALGNADTIVERLDDAFFDERGRATTRIQVRALSLVGTAPVRTACGAFHVRAVLDGVQPITKMRIVQRHEAGGFYVANLALNVKLLFTPVQARNARPLELKESIRFNRNPPAPWTARRPAGLTVVHEDFVKVDTDGDGRPDTTLPGTSNFGAGSGGKQEKLIDGCHIYYENGYYKQHCPEVAIP